jgi:hypothetical protein
LLFRHGFGTMSTRRGYFSLSGLDPSGHGQCEFHVPKEFVDSLQRYGPEWKFLNLHVMKEVLADPIVIFEGLNRIGYDSGYVYSGLFSKRVIKLNVEAPPHPEMVGIVIVNPEDRGNIILDWNWRREDLDRRGFPEGWHTDFGGQKWAKT